MAGVVFGPLARAEVLEAFDWYAARSAMLGDQFIADIDTVVTRISGNPLQFPQMFRDLRRARLRHFPYGLFFRMEADTIHVIACFHASREPRRWQGRA